MGANFSAVAGFGVRVTAAKVDWSQPSLAALKKFVWEASDDSTHSYYADAETMFNDDNFEMDSFTAAFPNLRFVWCGNPYLSSNRGADQWFAFAAATYTKVDDVADYADLSKQSTVTSAAAKELLQLKLVVLEGESPRWYMVLNVS